MNALEIIQAVKEIENFYLDYYKEHWEKLISGLHYYMLCRGFSSIYKTNSSSLFVYIKNEHKEMFIDYVRDGLLVCCTLYGDNDWFIVEMRVVGHDLHQIKIGISDYLNTKHRLKEIPSLFEQFRKQIGTHYLDTFPLTTAPPERVSPEPLDNQSHQNLSQIDDDGLGQKSSQTDRVHSSAQSSSHNVGARSLAKHLSQIIGGRDPKQKSTQTGGGGRDLAQKSSHTGGAGL